MRTITTHHTNEANRRIALVADAISEKNGNASHVYTMTVLPVLDEDRQGDRVELVIINRRLQGIAFQDGPIGEVGVNGITNEVLLAIVIDRLEGFQSSKWANPHNAASLEHCHEALRQLELRTKEREARGVEGTHTV